MESTPRSGVVRSENHNSDSSGYELPKSPFHPIPRNYSASTIELYFLAIGTAIGGHYFSWNDGLRAGFWNFFGALIITGTAYICLILCISEMTATLPFSGTHDSIELKHDPQ